MAGTGQSDWTSGAPKWATAIVLGAASIACVAWAIGRDASAWRGGSAPTGRAMDAVQTGTPTVIPGAAPPGAGAAPIAPVSAPPLAVDAARTESKAGPPPVPAPQLRKLINVNTAGQGELELLPGIGPALAKRIIDYRTTKGPFRRVEDLDAVKGIGPKILERIRGQVMVE